MRKALLRTVASLLLVALVFTFADPPRLLQALGHPDPGWLLAGFVASSCAVLSGALRWQQLARWLEMEAPTKLFLLAQWRGMAANTVMPGAVLGGDALRTLHLQRAGNPLGSAAVSVALDRISGLWVLVVISLSISALALACGLLPPQALPLPWPLVALLALAALAAPPALWLLSSASRHHLPRKLAGLLDAIHARPHPLRQYGIQLFGSAAVQTFFIIAFSCGGRAVGLELPLWLFFIAAGPIFILAATPVSVGGWGTREAASALVLGLLGAPKELAVATAVLYGLFAALQGLLGAATLFPWKKSKTPA